MRSRNLRRTAFLVSALFALFAVAGTEARAQQTGAVSGTVASTAGQPLEAAQVLVVGTGLGTLTDTDGSFRIEEVPTGSQQVRVRLVGYQTVTRQVDVQAGQLATVEVQLSQSAIEMEQIVVTGTGSGGMQQKQLGNSVGGINAEQVENASIQNASEMMAAREPGVDILPSSGLAGEGSSIRIRGNASLTQSNEPLIYIDGVRMNRGGQFTELGGGFFAGTGGAGTGASSRLDDINPSSIERIEILKGAAAATLYGTEASNGVIQIFTKSGREGETRWTFEISQGMEFMPTDRIRNHGDWWGKPDPIGLVGEDARRRAIQEVWGYSDAGRYEVVEECLLCFMDERGRTTTASLSVSGGSEGLTYFVSGRYQNLNGTFGPHDIGPFETDGQIGNIDDESQRLSSTANLTIFPSDELQIQSRFNYAFTDQSAPQTTNNIFGIWPLAMDSQLRFASEDNYTGSPAFATVREVAQWTTEQEVDHFGGSVNGTLRPSQGFTVHATAGVDVTTSRSETLAPFGWDVDDFTNTATEGFKDVANDNQTQWTAELRGGWDTEFGGDFSSSLTVGGQGFITESMARGGGSSSFPGPGIEVASAGTDQFILETWTQNVNVGIFAQEQIGYKDWAFLTLGSRLDANSAFGENFDLVNYPKASLSIVVSDAAGWESETFSSLRVRGAFGESGLQPGAFDKFRTFSPAPSAEGPGLQPDNLGNPDLKPEVTREWEAGLEMGLFNDRVGFDATYWTRTTSDALVSRQFPVTGGFLANQLSNIGRLTASGLDLSANGTAIQSENVSVNVFANAAYLEENVDDLGGAPPIKAGGSYPRYRNFIKEGYAPGAFFGATPADVPIPLQASLTSCEAWTEQEALNFFSQPRSVDEFEVFPEDCESGRLDTFLGKPTPDWQGSAGLDIGFLQRFQLHTLFEYKGGNYFVQDLSGGFRQSNAIIGRNTPEAARVTSTLANPNSTAQERLDAALVWANELRALAPMSGMNMVHPADYLRWRELSLTYDTPRSFASALSLSSLSVSLRARNLELWVNDEYTGISPELNVNARCAEGSRDCNWLRSIEAWRMPLARRVTLRLQAQF